jgi:hypothetical protein
MVMFESNPPPDGAGDQVVNIHGFDGPTLLGGVTIYVDPVKL